MYGLTRVTPPAEEPVSLERARQHLRVAVTDDDPLIASWLRAAREMTEDHTGRAWVTQGCRLSLADWPCPEDDGAGSYGGVIRLPVRPVSAVSAVKYVATDGTLTTLAGSGWQAWLDHCPPLVAPAAEQVWPPVKTGQLAAVQVEFTAGYGSAAAVPETAKAAMLLCLGFWYEHRGDSQEPLGMARELGLPAAARNLLTTLMTGQY